MGAPTFLSVTDDRRFGLISNRIDHFEFFTDVEGRIVLISVTPAARIVVGEFRTFAEARQRAEAMIDDSSGASVSQKAEETGMKIHGEHVGDWFGQRSEQVLNDLRRYFAGTPGDQFTGRHFETLLGRDDPDSFGAHDILAMRTLSVEVGVDTAMRLLTDSELRIRITDLLQQIPGDVDLTDDGADEYVAPGSAADQLWALLVDLPQIGWVTAGKLLAAKRPRLIPILDSQVKSLLEYPDGQFWLSLRDALRSNPSVVGLLELADVPPFVSLLRRVDVALWMAATHAPRA